MKLFLRVAVMLCCLSTFGLDVVTKYAPTRNVQAQDRSDKKNQEEELAPLTEAERQLNPRDIVLGQPNFVADLELFASEGFGAHSWAEHIARKGSRYRKESQFWVFIGEIGRTSVRLYPQGKVYDDFVPPRGGGLVEGGVYEPGALALESDVAFTALGTVQIDGHKCVKIEAIRKGEPEKIYLYAANDLKNLIIVAQVLAEKRGLIQRLRNVSLDVPDYLFEIPSDFKPIEHDRWKKVELAKLTYKGSPSKDFGVFRASGGELFIWVRDAYYPWEYLYRPQQGTVEIAFQGLLVNRSGTYIWQTKETEAFSVTDYHRPSLSLIDAHLVVKPNGISFRSNSYKQDQATIDITW
jgi:hypothetical protein